MHKARFRWIFLPLLLLIQSCGTVNPASAPDLEPAASPSDLEPDPASEASFIPYGKNVRFEQISLEEGLSQSVVNAVLQDRKGFLWVGTNDGLNRYDGYAFTVFKPDENDPASLSNSVITAIVEDARGYLWIGTQQGGLNRYDPVSGEFTAYTRNGGNAQSVSSDFISSLCLDDQGLWIGTDNGLDYLDFQTGIFSHHYAPEDMPPDGFGLSSNNIRALFKDSNGLIWIGTASGGLNVYNPRANSFKLHKRDGSDSGSLSNNRVLSIAESPDGSIWVGTANGLNQFLPARNSFRRFENSRYRENSLAGNTVYSLRVDRSGGLWIGTNKGLDHYDPLTGKFIHHQSQPGVSKSLSNNQVLSIYEDRSGVLWIGTFGGGLNKYNRQQDRFAYHRNIPNDDNSLSDNFILAVLAEEKDRVWIGTLDNGLNLFEPASESFTRYQNNSAIPSSLSDNSVNALFMDSDGILWVGTGRALDRFDPARGRFTHFQPDFQIEGETALFDVTSIYEDTNGALWVGSNFGLMRFDRETNVFTEFVLAGRQDGIPDEYSITSILEDGNRHLWVGTFGDGLFGIDLETGQVARHLMESTGNSLSNNAVLCLFQDSKGALWVGTRGGGLNRLDLVSGAFTHYSESEGLPNSVIYGVLEDASGSLWISTNFGLSRFDPLRNTFRNFTVSDGLQSNEFSQNAYSQDGSGTMYFGGINGLNVFDPGDIVDNPFSPSIALTSLTLDGKPLETGQTPEYTTRIVLKWPRDSFEFEFSAFAFEQPGKNQYSYMLEGFDSEWIEIGSQRNGRYTNLPGGGYALRLRGSNSDGIWSEAPDAIEIVVVPPFWETWWFGGLLVVALGMSVAAGLRWRVKRVESRNLELERLVRKRTADLEKRSSEIEALYQADEKIIRSVTLNHIFQTLVDVSVSILQADRSVVFAWNESKRKMMPRVSQGFQPESLAVMCFNRDEGRIGAAMTTGKPVVVSVLDPDDLRSDVKPVVQTEGIQSFAHFPIVVDERVVAVFNVAYTRPNALTKDSIRLFSALVNRASMAIANMELFEQTRDLAVMEERNRLARDLHDSAKQKAFAALAQLGTVNVMAQAAASQGASPHISEAETLVYEVIQELNFLIQEIYPIALQEKGLPAVLRDYIFEWENRNDAVVSLMIKDERPLPLELEQAVYRVIQEALANVSRHSRAKRVEVSLAYHTGSLEVNMTDDGCGFNVDQKVTGLGFRSMRERIGSVRGTFQVQSAPGEGTRIFIKIPFKSNGGG